MGGGGGVEFSKRSGESSFNFLAVYVRRMREAGASNYCGRAMVSQESSRPVFRAKQCTVKISIYTQVRNI